MGGVNFVTLGAVPDAQNDGVQVAPINIAGATGGTVIAAVANKRIMVHGAHYQAAASVVLTVQDVAAGSTVNLTGAMTMAQGIPVVLPWQNYPWYTVAAGDALVFATGASVQMSGRIMYVQG